MKETKNQIISGLICSIIMLIAVIVYLCIGFVLNLWHPYWIIIVASGALCGIVGSVTNAIDKLKSIDKIEKEKQDK